jgi:preprotein translocase subunit SecE
VPPGGGTPRRSAGSIGRIETDVATETLDKVNTQTGDGAGDGGAVPATRGPGRFFEFLGEVRAELRRVTWPSRAEVYATTVVVILTSLVFGLYLFGIDLLLNSAVQRIFQRFGGA